MRMFLGLSNWLASGAAVCSCWLIFPQLEAQVRPRSISAMFFIVRLLLGIVMSTRSRTVCGAFRVRHEVSYREASLLVIWVTAPDCAREGFLRLSSRSGALIRELRTAHLGNWRLRLHARFLGRD